MDWPIPRGCRPEPRRLMAFLSAVFIVLATATGCGDDDSSGSGSSGGASTDGGSVPREVSAKLDALKEVPAFEAPGPKIDVASLQGKTLYVIPFSSSAEFPQLQAEGMKEAGEAAGLNVKIFTNSGVPAQWQQGMNRAIAEDAAAIVIGMDPRALGPQIAKAEAAGIPVVVTHAIEATMEQEVTSEVPGTYVGARAPFTEASKLLADYVAQQSGGEAHAAYITQDDMVGYMPAMLKAFQDEMAAVCPDCTVEQVSTTFADAATKTPTAVQAALRKNPDIDWLIPSFDNLTPFVLSALRLSGKTDAVKVAAYNGTPAVLGDITEEGPLLMNIGEPAVVAGYSAVDQAMRLMLGEEPVDQVPYLRMFDASNVSEAGDPPKATEGYGDASSFLDGFKRLWGI